MSLRFSEAFGSNAPKPKVLGRIGAVPQKEPTAEERKALAGMTASQRMKFAFGRDPSTAARQALAAEQAAEQAALPKASKLAELSDADLGAYVRRLLELQEGE
jgi:hypothetical protein